MDCRAVGATGDIRVLSEDDAGPGQTLTTDAEIPTDVWLSLGRGARLVAKDPRTTRETIFAGPAHVRPCVGHREDSWISAGVFESTPGAGETPGSEEWVVTPLAVVRYASAKVRVTVRPDATIVTVPGGVAFVRLQDDARLSGPLNTPLADAGPPPKSQEPWQRVSETTLEIRPLGRRSAMEAARSAVDECATLAQRAQALAQLILPHEIGDGGNPNLKDTIVAQVTTRRLARAACAVAKLRTRALPPSQDRSTWEASLGQDETQWSALAAPPTAR